MTPPNSSRVHTVLNKLVTTKLTEPAEQQRVILLLSGQALKLTAANSIKKLYIQDSIQRLRLRLDVAKWHRKMRSELQLHTETET